MQCFRCLSLSSSSQIRLTYQVQKVNQQRLKKQKEILKKKQNQAKKPKLPVVEIPHMASIADLAKITNNSFDQVFTAFEVVSPDLHLSKHTKINDMKLVTAAMRILGLRCKSQAKIRETISKEDLDAHRSPPTTDKSRLSPRPPIVTIMGHIDHGKTTLLDALRHTNVVEGEAGGITQAIGAFSVDVSTDEKVTFLDTPGHAAFSAMRKRGALATDMVVLVVAADDGVMEQTLESINAIKLAGVPAIVAVNKCDLKKANPSKVYEGLAEHGIVVDELGGDVQSVKISALKKEGLDHLVDSILLQANLLELAADQQANVEGVVVESRMSPQGALASVIVQQGTLTKGQWLVAGTNMAKVKRLDDNNKQLIEVLPGWPVNVLGWKSVPNAGDVVLQVKNEARAKEVVQWRTKLKEEEKGMLEQEVISQQREQMRKEYKEIRSTEHRKIQRLYKIQELVAKRYEKTDDVLERHLLIKADVDGSLDALLNVLETYDCNDQCELKIADFSLGNIKPSDIERAALFNGVICCFNIEPSEEIEKLAEEQNVTIISSNIIYHLINKLKDNLSASLPQVEQINVVGEATVKNLFEFHKKKDKFTIAGCMVTSGSVHKDSLSRIIRNNEVIAEGTLSSLKSYNNDVKSVSAGKDCGLIVDADEVPQEGDRIQCCETEMVNDFIRWNPPGF